MTTCTICGAIIPDNGGHNSPWTFIAQDKQDVHLRYGDLICGECYTEIWGTIQLALKRILSNLKDLREGQSARELPKTSSGADMVAIFRRVVAAYSPRAGDRSSRD